MDKNITISLKQLQSDGKWSEDEAGLVVLAQAGTLTSDALDISHTRGEIQIQVEHTKAGAPTITGEILESVDGITFVENGTGFGDAIAKDVPTLFYHDAKANRHIKIKITEDNTAPTDVTLSLGIR